MPYCFAESPSCFCSKVQNWFFVNKKKQIFRRLISPIFFSPHVDWWFDTPDWRILEEGQGNYSNSKNDNRKTKLLWKRNHFSSKYFSGSAISCCKNPEENFFNTKALFFSPQSPNKFGIQFWKNCFSSKLSKST